MTKNIQKEEYMEDTPPTKHDLNVRTQSLQSKLVKLCYKH